MGNGDDDRSAISVMMLGGGAFSPTDIPNLLIWLDANSITGLNNGDEITTWANLGSEGDATGVAGSVPTYRTNVQNGRPVARYDGIGDSLTIADTANLTWQAPWSVYVVATTTSVAAGAPRIISKSDSAGLGRDGDDLVFTTYAILDYITAGVSWTANTFATHGYLFDNTDLDVDFRTNGAADETVAGTTNSNAGTGATAIGERGNGTLHWSGDIGEILVYARMLSASEISDVETYLRNRWATW